MPWQEVSSMSQRRDFIGLALAPGANVSELCRRFGISRKTGNKWLARFRGEGAVGLEDRSRRPRHSPARTTEQVEADILALRDEHPAWGGRKLKARMEALGHTVVPSASTITAILERHGKLCPERRMQRNWQRFEHEAPNRLWQMDFKGHFATEQGRCHPLTLVDDHSRYNLCLRAFDNERCDTVQQALLEVFRRYGLPERILCDNGSPWGDDADTPHTRLTVWLMRVGVGVSHGRPYHPQTQGKEERFHRTLQAEVVRRYTFRDLDDCQARFDRWREIYNHQRPHEALGLAVPSSRYKASWRSYPETLPPVEYAQGETVRRVDQNGRLSYGGRMWRAGKAFRDLPVALRQGDQDGVMDLYFCAHKVGSIDLRQNS